MKEAESKAAGAIPLWRRIVNFPLIAMIIAITMFFLVNAVARQLGKLLPAMAPDAAAICKAVIAVGLMLAAYKLVIARLGERPRQYRLDHRRKRMSWRQHWNGRMEVCLAQRARRGTRECNRAR